MTARRLAFSWIPFALAIVPSVVTGRAMASASVAPSRGEAPGAEATAPTERRSLVIETIEVQGNTRTSAALVVTLSGLAAGDDASVGTILSAAERLRERRLFRSVDVHTRPGATPGRVTVVFDVVENRPHVRLGAGYEDLSGWYLIPVQLNLDNSFGRAEELRLSTRFGYRVAGVDLTYRKPDPRDPWRFTQVRFSAEGADHIYFDETTEIAHEVSGGRLEFRMGRRLGHSFAAEGWVASAAFEPDSSARVYHTNEDAGLVRGEDVPFEDVPSVLHRDLVRREELRLGLAAIVDTRDGRALATRGVWGRLVGELALSGKSNFGMGLWDLRAYLPLRNGLALAVRTRLGAVTAHAPFYERFYLGGLYTVRGYASQSLSPPNGTRHLASASVELRAPLVGTADRPSLTAITFLDAGLGWNARARIEDGAAGFGWGVRARVPFLGQLGLDVGIPLSDSPRSESFHVNGVIGWTF
jgi:outer membrane protein assembly factor BamA